MFGLYSSVHVAQSNGYCLRATNQRRCWWQHLRFHVSPAALGSAETPGRRRWSTWGGPPWEEQSEWDSESTTGTEAKPFTGGWTHRPFSALKSLIPSAGPQICMTSSLVSFNKSAPSAREQSWYEHVTTGSFDLPRSKTSEKTENNYKKKHLGTQLCAHITFNST